MKQKIINIYSFKELDESAREKVVDKFRIDQDINFEFAIDEFKSQLSNDFGIKNPSILFSGFYSQGDGACFTCDNIDLTKFCAALKIKSKFKTLLKYSDDYIQIRIKHNHRYYHERSTDTSIDFSPTYLADKTIIAVEKQLANFELIFEEWALAKCKEIYKALQDENDFQTSNETIIETIEANNYEFDEYGNIA